MSTINKIQINFNFYFLDLPNMEQVLKSLKISPGHIIKISKEILKL